MPLIFIKSKNVLTKYRCVILKLFNSCSKIYMQFKKKPIIYYIILELD